MTNNTKEPIVHEMVMQRWESSNTVHGRTNNPYDTNRIVGGSSGGEGCLQAAAGSAFGVGSDIGGSIRMPAFFNGVFGHKPSKNIISTVGQYPVPISKEQNSFLGLGPITRRAEDLLPLFKIMAKSSAAQLQLDKPVDVKKLRFFYQDNDTGCPMVSPVDKEIRGLFQKVVYHFNKAHKIKLERLNLEPFRESKDIWLYCMRNTSHSFQEQLANLDGSINVSWELFKWIFGCSKHTFIALCTALLENSSASYGSATHQMFVEKRDRFRTEISDLLGEDGILLYPTHPTAAPYHSQPLFKPFNFSYTGIINVLGFPATHIPLGLNSEGLPIGIQVIGNDKCDRLCLAVAAELEKAFGGWVPPEIDA